jgi:uncharacterized protein YqfB (UPF0267 family)
MNVIKIEYKDDRDWTRELDGVVIDHGNYAQKYKKERIQPAWALPEVVTDTWNGKETDIQHIRHDAKYFQINIKESEIFDFNIMKSCSDIKITHYSEDSSGAIITDIDIPDLTKSDLLDIREPERAADTTGHVIEIVYRVNRTVINKCLPVDNTNYIEFIANVNLTKFSSQLLSSTKVFRLADNEAIFVDTIGLQKFVFASNQWSQTGNKLNIGDCEVAGISSTAIALVDSNGDLGYYELSGGTWSLTGNKLNVATSGDIVSLAKVASNEVAIANETTGEIEQFTFSSPNWSSSSSVRLLGSVSNVYITEWDSAASNTFLYIDSTNNQIRIYRYTTSWTITNLSATITGACAIERINGSGTNGGVVLADQSDTYRTYDITGSVLTLLGTKEINVSSSPYMAQLETDKISITEPTEITSYEYGNVKYYTDYDILEYNRQTEPTYVDWPNGDRKLARTIDKKGYEILIFTPTSDYDDLIKDLNITNEIKINTETVSEIEYEVSEVAEDIRKIIIRGISETTQTDVNLSPLNTYVLSMNSGATNYYSDYPIHEDIREVQKIEVEWPDGSKKLYKIIRKLTKEFTYFTDDPQTIIDNVNTYSDVTLNSDVLSEIETNTEEIALKLYKVVINGVYNVDTTTYSLSPLNTYVLSMNSAAINYYSDYSIVDNIREVQKIEVEWSDGSIKVLQTIKKQTHNFVYFTDSPDAITTDVHTYNDVTLNSDVLTEIEVEQEELYINLFKIKISGVYNLDVDTIYAFPTSGNNLEITDETPTVYNYYSQYSVLNVSEEPEINYIEDDTGIKTSSKAITKQVYQFKYYNTEAKAYELKEKFELSKSGWTVTLNAATVYEARALEPTRLGVDLYEVIVNCLMDVTAN